MIDEGRAYGYCIEDISKIENYDKAKKDNSHIWICHHKLEIRDGYRNSAADLKLMNLYYHRPAAELIFVTNEDHMKLHRTGAKRSQEEIAKWREHMKGRTPWNKGIKTGKPSWNSGKTIKDDSRIKPAWNKGLNKATDARVAKYGNTRKERLKEVC